MSTRALHPDTELQAMEAELKWLEARCRRLELQRKVSGVPLARGRHRWRDEEERNPRDLRSRLKAAVDAEQAERERIDRARKEHAEAGQPRALDRLVQSCGLDEFERNTLLLACAPVFSTRFNALYEGISSESYMGSGCSVELAFLFNEVGFGERVRRRKCFSPRSNLVANDLVSVDMGSRYTSPEDLLTATIQVNSRVFSFLVGEEGLDDAFLDFSSLQVPWASLDEVVLPDEHRQRILAVVQHHERFLETRKAWGLDERIPYGRGQLMLFHGPPGTGKTLTAHAVADALGLRVLQVDIPAFVEHMDAQRFLPGLFREARLQGAMLFFDECELLFSDRRRGNSLMTMLLTELERFDGVAVLATNLPGELDPALERRILVRLGFRQPDLEARESIWRQHVPEQAARRGELDFRRLASGFEISGGLIKNAVLGAVAGAVRQDPESPALDQGLLEAAASDQLQRVADEAGELLHPKARLRDLVLPEPVAASIEEIVLAARSWRTVLDRWKVGEHLSSGKGLTALLHGPPGTGKTLTAEAIAGELGRPLVRASLPSLMSRYVGDTEQRLGALFQRAASGNAVLLLDEIDSLLMERGAARASRHDDSVVNTLLQQLDAHSGLALLATNLPEHLDRALDRRLTWRIGFRAPDARLRARIWRGLVPEQEGIELDFDALARWELTGGEIKNAVFKAAFRAASQGETLSQERLEEAASERAKSARPTQRIAGFGAQAR